MAKNKGKFGKGKSAVETTDEFVSTVDRIARRLRPHAVPLAVGVAVAIIAIVGYGAWTWYRDRQAAAATELFREATTTANAPLSPAEETPEDDAKPPEPDTGNAAAKKYTSADERGKAVVEALDRLSSDYGSTKVRDESRLLRAATMLDLGRYDEAITLYDEYADKGDIDALRQVAREGLGYALEAKAVASQDAAARQKALEDALAAFDKIQPNEEGPGRDVALYHQGRILAMLERRDEAIEKFRKALEVPDTSLKPQLEYRLASLESGATPKK